MTLREIIEDADGSLQDNTVLAIQNDPYRLDTPAYHVIAQWFVEQLALHPGHGGQRHVRGLHYALLNASPAKPNAKAYSNTFEDWRWLVATASKAARWLGYVPFDAIRDERNDEPIIRIHERNDGDPEGYLNAEPLATLGEVVVNFGAAAQLTGFEPEQRYRLLIFGEKSSLDPIVGPLAERFQADLYLGAGELSDTRIYQMALEGARDGRKLIVFTLSDFDPSGHQMPISIARKLQAFRDLLFPDLEFEVHPIGLTADQAEEFDLPSEPLKDGERRKDAWFEAWGRE